VDALGASRAAVAYVARAPDVVLAVQAEDRLVKEAYLKVVLWLDLVLADGPVRQRGEVVGVGCVGEVGELHVVRDGCC